MNKVIILRGIPGSGKSYKAELLAKAHKAIDNSLVIILSTDDFNTDENGVYKFNPESHKLCLRKYVDFLTTCSTSPGLVIVDNTNTRLLEAAPYYALAETYGCLRSILTIHCPVDLALARNKHNVPEDVIKRMYVTLEEETARIPPWWVHTEEYAQRDNPITSALPMVDMKKVQGFLAVRAQKQNLQTILEGASKRLGEANQAYDDLVMGLTPEEVEVIRSFLNTGVLK